MAAASYKLTYFNLMGLGESLCYLLSYGGVEFEDERILHENWPKIKQNMPFGQMPILEVNGKRAHQTVAMARYLAKQFKLTGKDDWEDLEIDAIVDSVVDFRLKLGAYFFETDEVVKTKLKETVDKETIPFYLDRFESIAQSNKGHLALGRLTWADVYFASYVTVFNSYCGYNIFVGKENLQAVINNVENLPSIKAWIEKRPKTETKKEDKTEKSCGASSSTQKPYQSFNDNDFSESTNEEEKISDYDSEYKNLIDEKSNITSKMWKHLRVTKEINIGESSLDRKKNSSDEISYDEQSLEEDSCKEDFDKKKKSFISGARPKDETREEKKARKNEVKSKQAEKRLTKMKKHVKKRLVKNSKKRHRKKN